jgi:ParB family chromosome partitioning protein
MQVINLPATQLHSAPWNPNAMTPAMQGHLAASVDRFGLVVPVVVRPDGSDGYEVLGGNQRLAALQARGVDPIPCVVVAVDETEARLLAQALNAIHGADDWNAKAALVRELLSALPAATVGALLPDTPTALASWATLGQQGPDTLAQAVTVWDRAKAVRLERVSFPFTPSQKATVDAAITQALPEVADSTPTPNRRALALVAICTAWLALAAPGVGRPTPPNQEDAPHDDA